MTAKPWMIATLALAVLAGCDRPDDQRTDTLDPVEARQERESFPPELVAHLDSGSAAFRADEYDQALRHYQAVTEIDDQVAAGWFGIYMVHNARGEEEEAVAALERARELAPGASILHPTPGDTTP